MDNSFVLPANLSCGSKAESPRSHCFEPPADDHLSVALEHGQSPPLLSQRGYKTYAFLRLPSFLSQRSNRSVAERNRLSKWWPLLARSFTLISFPAHPEGANRLITFSFGRATDGQTYLDRSEEHTSELQSRE